MNSQSVPCVAVMDRNPHVRDFLARELSGLHVRTVAVRDGAEILALLGSPPRPQLLILEPEAAGTALPRLVRRLAELKDEVAVVLHIFPGDESGLVPGAVVVEKQADLTALKQAVNAILQRGKGRGPAGCGADRNACGTVPQQAK